MTIEYKDSKRIVGLSQLAITHDTTSSTESSGSVSSLTHNMTVADNSNRVLIACVSSYGSAPTITGVTWNGDSMTAVPNSESYQSGSNNRTQLYYIIAPDTGSHSIVASFSGSATCGIGGMSFYNVHQTTPVGAGNTSSATSTATSSLALTPTVTGSWIIAMISSSSSLGSATGLTQSYTEGTNALLRGGRNESPTIGSANTVGWGTSNSSHAMSGCAIIPYGDEKPTDVQDNSILVEKDTARRYWFDGTTWTRGFFRLTGIGVFAGGHDGSYTNIMDYITIATTGNAIDFGDLTVSRSGIAGMSNGTRGVFAGGGISTYVATNVMDYITIATTGNATDFGDLTSTRGNCSGVSNDTRGVISLGDSGGGGSPTSQMDYITIATTGNSTSFGNSTVTTYSHRGVNNDTRGCFSGGWTGSANTNNIDYITIATTGNATDFGDLLSTMRNHGGNVNSSTRGIYHGGITSTRINVMQYITIGTPSNATDFGDLSAVQSGSTGVSSETRGVIDCGYTGSAQQNNIEYVTIDTLGNATDFGDSTVARNSTGGVDQV